MYEAYDRYVKNTIYDAMVGYATALTGQFKKTGSLTAENLNALCDLISTATGYPVMIMGTRTALSKVTALQNSLYISDVMKEEHRTKGLLGMWEGKELVEIPQVFEKNKVGSYKIDNTLLWIMPMTDIKWIKLVNEGDTQLRAITDKDTNIDLFANNQTSKNASDGSNYIKLVFTNPSNAMFKVTFIGYYNK